MSISVVQAFAKKLPRPAQPRRKRYRARHLIGSQLESVAELQHLLGDHAQMWQHSRRVLTVMVARTVGIKRAEVITARLVQDDRGWLRLAG
jgi:hypothetical protein